MNWLKIGIVLALTLGAMRISSWVVGWALARFTSLPSRATAVLANLAAFVAFVGLLWRNLLPGEPLDWEAVLFGFVVYTLCCLVDFIWLPWKPRVTTAAPR